MPTDDVAKVRAHYAERGARYAKRFADDRPEVRYSWSRLADRIEAALREAGVDLTRARVLDLGCGTGRTLHWLFDRGVAPGRAVGVDLVAARLRASSARAPAAPLAMADGAVLPFRDGGFDAILLLTTLSSMPSETMRRQAASEMMRALRPGGVVICHEFIRKNPLNPHTVALRPQTIRELFAGGGVALQRVALHPLLVRLLLPLGPRLLDALEGIRSLRSHCLAVVTKPTRG